MIPKRRIPWRWLGCLIVWLVSCQQPAVLPPPPPTPTSPPVNLHLGITDAATNLVELITPAYGVHTTQARLELVTGNDEALLADLDQKFLDAILVHAIPENRDDWFNPIAVDGLVFLIDPDNGISSLTPNQIQDIFSGRTLTWAGVGGEDQPIQLLTREAGAGARTLFQARIMAEQRVSITALVQPDDAAMQQAVVATPGSIGYSMMGQSSSQVSARMLAVAGISPTPATTANQTYPLSAPLYFVSLVEPQGELRAFLAWLQSEAGQVLLSEKYGRVR